MSSKLLGHRAALCNIVRRIAIEAGELTLDYFDEAGFDGAMIKSDGSPVTKADQEAEKLIETGLARMLPEVPMIGEELIAEGHSPPDLTSEEYFWLVDPLDGTKEFVSGSSDYTVNIALIHNKKPVLGVIYAPALGELYYGYTEVNGDQKAFRWFEDTDTEKPLSVRKAPSRGLTVVSSRRHGSTDRMEKFMSDYKIDKMVKRGSSLKICLIAAGKADIYPRFGPTCEWDTAAGDAILRAAGGMVKQLDGTPFVYGRGDPKFLNPDFIAASNDVFELS